MAVSVSHLTAYDLTVGVIVDMDEAIFMVSAQDSPLLTGVDSDGMQILGSRGTTQTKFDWMHDEILTPRSNLTVNLVTATAFITVTSGHRERFSTGDVLRLIDTNHEFLQVTGYGSTAHTLTVTRSFGADAATTHDTGDVVIQVGLALSEGSDPENPRARDRDEFYNHTQIFGPTKIKMSRTEQLIAKYGVSNEMAYQLDKRVTENVIGREQAFLYGERTNDSTNKKRTTGGLEYFITTNVNTAATQLTETAVYTLQQTLWDAGGEGRLLIANPKTLLNLNSLTDSNRVRVDFADSRRGRVPVTNVITEFGVVTIARNRWCRVEDAFLVNKENITRRVITPLRLERLAKTGDSDSMQIVCEEGLEVKGQDHMGRWTGLTAA